MCGRYKCFGLIVLIPGYFIFPVVPIVVVLCVYAGVKSAVVELCSFTSLSSSSRSAVVQWLASWTSDLKVGGLRL